MGGRRATPLCDLLSLHSSNRGSLEEVLLILEHGRIGNLSRKVEHVVHSASELLLSSIRDVATGVWHRTAP